MATGVDRARSLASSIWLFRDLPQPAVDLLVRHMRSVTYRPDQVIFRKGDPGTSMLLVVDGRVKVCSTSWDGREILFNLIDAGDVFGEIALLDGRERTADAISMERTTLQVLDRRDLLPVIRKNPEIGIRLLSILCQRLRRTSEQVEDLVFLEHRARLAKLLLWLATRYGEPSSDGIAIALKLSQRELGTLVGVRREAMNRQLAEWRAAGLLAVRRGVITISDIAAFEAMVQGLPD
jgi:CRP/FNR family transcriptional regulator, cyclic AMP receptor protein